MQRLVILRKRLGKKKKSGFGFNAQYRRIENYQLAYKPKRFVARWSYLTYQPSLNDDKLHIAYWPRYNAPAQDYGEEGFPGQFSMDDSKRVKPCI